jgi:cobalt-zinc-cadmium resistance protein CzcA
MLRSLIAWRVGNPLILLLCVAALAAVGGYSFITINVEACPNPAAVIIEVTAQYHVASAEVVERQVTVPPEVPLAVMPRSRYAHSKSQGKLSRVRNQFEHGFDHIRARKQVINRLAAVTRMPIGVSPQLSPIRPTTRWLDWPRA